MAYRIDILTILPQLLTGPFDDSILKRAQSKGLVEIHLHDIRKEAQNKHNTVDDYQYGGGAGMVLQAEPIARVIDQLMQSTKYDDVIFLTPDGELLKQTMANQLSLKSNIVLICGHYKGIDQRIRDKYVTKEISIGDYVLSGGELAAAVLCDAIIRLLPGVLNDETSALEDSHQDNLLAPPVYTRPEDWRGMKVPEILLSGNEKKINEWRLEQAYQKTVKIRPDLLNEY